MVRNNMKAGMRIESSSYFEDNVVFTHCFDNYNDYIEFGFKLVFDLQELLDGDIVFEVIDADRMSYKTLYRINILEALPIIEAIIERESLIIRALYDSVVDESLVFSENVDTFVLGAYQLDNLISIRDEILKIMNYGGVSNAVSD
jgi:hypothetical protein